MRQAPAHVQALLAPVIQALGYELVGIEYLSQGRGAVLRVYIDSPTGISADDCKRVSHQVSGVLDVEDPIAGSYDLEVSSPGLDRPLFTAEQFARFVGHKARIRLSVPLDGRRNFSGVLEGVEDNAVLVEEDGVQFCLSLSAIDKARLVPDV